MANHKSKRSTRSPKRGKGKNHSVNRERSKLEQKQARVSKRKREVNDKKQQRYKLAHRLFFLGYGENYGDCVKKAFSLNSNFFVNTKKIEDWLK